MHLQRAPTAAQALYRVFVQPCSLVAAPARCLSRRHIVPVNRQPHRSLNKYRKVTAEFVPSMFNDPNKPVDEAIKAPNVHMVRDGKLEMDQPLRALLGEVRKLNEKLAKEGAPKGDTVHVRQHAVHGDGKPIVKFVTEREVREQILAQTKKVKKVEEKSKQLELNWALDQRGDLPHRLIRLKEFLSEGRRVEILLANKKGGRRATLPEMETLLEQLRAAVAEVEGGEEVKPMEGKMGGRATLVFGVKNVFSSKSAKTSQEAPEPDEKEDKMARREREKTERRAKEAERQRKAEERAAELEKQRGFKVENL